MRLDGDSHPQRPRRRHKNKEEHGLACICMRSFVFYCVFFENQALVWLRSAPSTRRCDSSGSVIGQSMQWQDGPHVGGQCGRVTVYSPSKQAEQWSLRSRKQDGVSLVLPLHKRKNTDDCVCLMSFGMRLQLESGPKQQSDVGSALKWLLDCCFLVFLMKSA